MFSIREVAQKFDITYDTLRYYEEKGLLTNIKRDAQGRRTYTATNLDEITKIVHMRQLGATVNEILNLKRDDLSKDDLNNILNFLDTIDRRLEKQAQNIQQQKDFITSKRQKIQSDISKFDKNNL